MAGRITAFALAFMLFLSCASADATVDDVSKYLGDDVSAMSTDELTLVIDYLRYKARLIYEYIDVIERLIDPDGKAVTIPEGLWVIGEDIPAGRWNITVPPNAETTIAYGKDLMFNGTKINPFSGGCQLYTLRGVLHPDTSDVSPDNVDIRMENGTFFQVVGSSVIFTPSKDKSSLGFDW